MMELQETTGLMCSANYRERFVAEYAQTKIRYERLKAFNTKIEAAHHMAYVKSVDAEDKSPRVEMPKHDCPDELLRDQQRVMGEYLHILELRAVIEGVELPK